MRSTLIHLALALSLGTWGASGAIAAPDPSANPTPPSRSAVNSLPVSPETSPATNPAANPETSPKTSPKTSPETNPETSQRLIVSLRQRRVTLLQGPNPILSYPIAIGRRGWETPTGHYQVFQMIRNPAWQHPWNGSVIGPGQGNPLGDRWIGFWSDGKNAIGFHGTTNEELIGQAVSHGCIRMKNKDVRSLFEQITIGTPVIIEP